MAARIYPTQSITARKFQSSPQHRPQRHQNRCRSTVERQFLSRNRLARKSECSAFNAVARIQASGTPVTIRLVAQLIKLDPRQVRRVLKRMERQGLLKWRHDRAVYRNNRLQWVPIVLNWDGLKPQPALSSTGEPTRAKSFSESFKERTRLPFHRSRQDHAVAAVSAEKPLFVSESQNLPQESAFERYGEARIRELQKSYRRLAMSRGAAVVAMLEKYIEEGRARQQQSGGAP